MKKKISFFLIPAVFMLALSLWTGAYAAKASTGIEPSSILDSPFLAQLLGAKPGVIQSPSAGGTGGTVAIVDVSQDANQQSDSLAVTETPDASLDNIVTPEPQQDAQSKDQNEATPSGQINDSQDVTGVVQALDASTITVDGVVYNLNSFSEVGGALQTGDTVKLEFLTNPDGSLTVSEVNISEQLGSSDSTSSSGNNKKDEHKSVTASGSSSGGHEEHSGPSSSGSSDGSSSDD